MLSDYNFHLCYLKFDEPLLLHTKETSVVVVVWAHVTGISVLLVHSWCVRRYTCKLVGTDHAILVHVNTEHSTNVLFT